MFKIAQLVDCRARARPQVGQRVALKVVLAMYRVSGTGNSVTNYNLSKSKSGASLVIINPWISPAGLESGGGPGVKCLESGVSNPQPTGYMRPRMAMNVAQHKIIKLLKTFFCSSPFVSIGVFNVWPKTTLLPVWPRDTERLDTLGRWRRAFDPLDITEVLKQCTPLIPDCPHCSYFSA